MAPITATYVMSTGICLLSIIQLRYDSFEEMQRQTTRFMRMIDIGCQ